MRVHIHCMRLKDCSASARLQLDKYLHSGNLSGKPLSNQDICNFTFTQLHTFHSHYTHELFSHMHSVDIVSVKDEFRTWPSLSLIAEHMYLSHCDIKFFFFYLPGVAFNSFDQFIYYSY